MPSGVRESIVAAVAIAGVSTLGDFIWVSWSLRHQVSYGLTHGTLLFLAIGLVLGAFAGRPLVGGLGGAAIGFLAAGSFYVLSPVAGYAVMFAIWPAVWIALGIFNDRLNRHGRLRTAVLRGLAAAAVSGIAFYAVSGIWFPFNPRGWDYLVHLGAWTLAYLPGFAALLMGTERSSDGSSRMGDLGRQRGPNDIQSNTEDFRTGMDPHDRRGGGRE